MMLDILMDICKNLLLNWVKNARERKQLERQLQEYMIRFLQENEFCSREAEIDFTGLCEYFRDKLIDDVIEYITAHGDRRNGIENKIVEKAINHSRADNKVSKERVITFTKRMLDMIYDFFRKQIPLEERLLAGEIEENQNDIKNRLEVVQKDLSEQSDKIQSLIQLVSAEKWDRTDINKFIDKQLGYVRNLSIFPWFKNSIKYSDAFPKLFINPSMMIQNRTVSIGDLIQYENKNLVILGDAGAGKSTLLRFYFAFFEFPKSECIYLSALDASKTDLFTSILDYVKTDNKNHYLFLIDGIDEYYHNNIGEYYSFISRIRTSINCNFWLGCRTDFFQCYRGDNTSFSESECILSPWNTVQSESFIEIYSKIIEKPYLINNINKLIGMEYNIIQMKSNPFQLTLLVFLAEESVSVPISGIFDLYKRFLVKWLDHEQKHGRCYNDNIKIINTLIKAAYIIYDGGSFLFDDVANNNTAVSELLIVDENTEVTGNRIASAFYHRSLAAFMLAYNVVELMLSDDKEQLKKSLPYKLKDDVTNFIGNRFSVMNDKEKLRVKRTLSSVFFSVEDDEYNIRIKEQAIYFITRLGIDVSDFLIDVIKSNPQNQIMKLTLAYGCVLSDSPVIRSYAFHYAKALARYNSEEAITNRGWTVIYFGDIITGIDDKCEIDPYTYRDTIKGSWEKARLARIKRFTKVNPRLKDYRFRLFDVPLFHSFLIDRNWDNISDYELGIIKDISIPSDIFNNEEIAFLTEEKRKLIEDYEKHLQKKG